MNYYCNLLFVPMGVGKKYFPYLLALYLIIRHDFWLKSERSLLQVTLLITC
jgi:hypothetical protein